MAKHFAVYNQETDRGVLDDQVSSRALEELYLPPFDAAVTQAHVATAMCAYPQLNGTYQCQDPTLLGQLARWGFTGFIRSDLGSVHDPVAAIDAGVDLIKPSSVHRLDLLVREHRLGMAAVDRAVSRLLTVVFAHDLEDRAPTGSPGTAVDSDSHTDFAPDCGRAIGRPAEGCRRRPAAPGVGPPVGGGHRGRRRVRAGHLRQRELARAAPVHLLTPGRHPAPGREPHHGHLHQWREHHRPAGPGPDPVPDPGIGPRATG